MARFRNNDRRIIAVAAETSHLDPAGFFVEVEESGIIVNHQQSMKWSEEERKKIEKNVERLTGKKCWVT